MGETRAKQVQESLRWQGCWKQHEVLLLWQRKGERKIGSGKHLVWLLLLCWMAQGYLVLRTSHQNIFYCSARYCIYSKRKKAPTPSMKVFKALIRDELRQKYRGNGDIRKSKSAEDKTALQWLKVEMGWTLPAINGNTLINLNPWRNKHYKYWQGRNQNSKTFRVDSSK